MRYKAPGSFRQADDLRARITELGLAIELDEVLEGADGPLGEPLDVAGLRLPNRFAIHPMEGWDGTRDGAPSELTRERWRNFGRSGAGLVWGGEAFAVRADGRANPNQLFLNDEADTAGVLASLRDEILAGRREAGHDPDAGPIGLQLTHSGRWSRPDGEPAPAIATHDPELDRRVGLDADAPLLADAELEAIGERYVDAARLAAGAGYDFVDVKACHGYLLHELLGARGRPGAYGGSFEGRTRLFRRIVEAIGAACPDLAIGVRVSLADLVPYRRDPGTGRGEPAVEAWEHGFDVDGGGEGVRFLELVRSLGVGMVNVTLGSPYYNPHVQRPAAYPPSDGYEPPNDPLVEVARHLETVRAAKRACPDLVFVGSGYTYLMDWLPHVAQAEVRAGGVDVVGLGRMVLSYPELPADVLAGRTLARKRVCRTFSDCTTAPRNGMVSGCYPLDPRYKSRPEAARVKEIKRGADA